jgi:hypothetical protein
MTLKTEPVADDSGQATGGPAQVAPVKIAASTATGSNWLSLVTSRLLSATATTPARQLSCIADGSPIPLVYGEDRIGGKVLDVVPWTNTTTGVKYVLIPVLWCHACESVSEITFNDRPIDETTPLYATYLGTQTNPNSALVDAYAQFGISYADSLNGFAYSIIWLPENRFNGSLQIAGLVRGRKVYDPRSTLTAWSDNPALIAADFLASSAYGAAKTVDYDSVIAAANANDEAIGSDKRRRCGVTFEGLLNANAVAETLRAYAGVFYIPSAAGIKLLPDRPATSVANYSHDAGNIAACRVQKKDSGNVPTVSEVVYTDRTTLPWREGRAVVQVAGVDVTVPRRLTTVPMPGIQSRSQATREATERLNKLRTADLTITLDVFDAGIAHEIGDVVSVTYPPSGITPEKQFRLTADPELIGPGMWRLACAEYDPTAYSNAVVSEGSTPDTGLTNPLAPPATPTGLAYTFSDNGIELTWTRNLELTVAEYELRVGASWAAGVPLVGVTPTLAAGTTFTWPPQAAGSRTVWIKARTDLGVESVAAASVTVVINAPVLSTLTPTISGPNYVLDWTLSATSLPVAFYRVRRAGVVIAEVSASRFSALANWSGSVSFSVAAVDTFGNEGAALSQAISITSPSAVGSFTASTVVNTVVFYWTAPSATLPVSSYLLKKGATWAGGATIGRKAGDQTFTTFLESEAGEFTYWLAAIDSAGNEGTPTSLTVRVAALANFKLTNQWTSTFSGTKTGCVVENGALLAPVNTTETFGDHFTTRSWTTPDQQIAAGYELFIQPSGTSATYVETFDATNGASTNISSSLVSVTATGAVLDGAVTVTPKIEIATNAAPSSWTSLGNVWEALASGFRYVRVTLTFTAAGGDDLYQLTALGVKLSLQTEIDSGSKASGDFTGTPPTCAVTFGKAFIDVDSIVVTPLGTARREAVVEFTDTPNPSGFTVRIFDPTTGNAVANGFTWQATGVV